MRQPAFREASELSQVRALDLICEDCGRTRRLSRPRLLDLERQGLRTLHALGARLICAACRERGGQGRNVSLRPQWRG